MVREATKRAIKKYKEKNRDKYAKWAREWSKKNPEKAKAIHQRYVEKNREKRVAKNNLNHALSIGRVERPTKCSACGDDTFTLHGHHKDYNKPLEVEWLCPLCHNKTHIDYKENK